MLPKLIFIVGPIKGTVFEITGDEIGIGRDLSNELSISDKALSRFHCRIRKEGEGFKLVDLDSHNGTFINEVPVRESELKHGDLIQAGSSSFFFLLYDEEQLNGTPSLQFDNESLVTGSAVKFKPEAVLYAMTRDLNVLMSVSSAISSVRSLQELQTRLLECVLQIVPATRAAIVLFREDKEEPDAVFVLHRQPSSHPTMNVSNTLVRQVLSERVAILSNEVLGSDTLGKSESFKAAGVRALLCVPLLVLDQVSGFIYLDTDEPGGSFTEWHLQIMTAVANFVASALNNMRSLEWLEGENKRLRAVINEERNIIGESASMEKVYSFIARVGRTDSTVLLCGESGTGKELVARSIHQHSARSRKPFVAVNCAALNETLLESELFGHERGAFTGAVAQKKGKFEVAEGGTIFLDEVGEMPTQIQARLLRVLQEREFERVGGTRTIKADIRVLAATNKDLGRAVAAGEFREDLYYRLNVVLLRMPPLRERPEDVLLLAHHFIAKYGRKCKRHVTGLSPGARRCLLSYGWPGNVRELENSIERAVVLGSTEYIQPEDLPEPVLEVAVASGQISTRYHESLREAKKQIVTKALAQAEGNYREAANQLGLHPNNLHRLIRNLGLKPSPGK
ncbi:MAG: sigma-54-dependent Fis family transcriptional regulator [Acidobacteria bacterium]|nr:MAG: sigma-54-dependent Fis family transcriptional regulator [Acidobacteriota bacterium]